MQTLIQALIKASLSFGEIAKDKINPHYKSKYASLDAVLKAINAALANNGLRIIQILEPDSRDAGQTLVTTLFHESGESISSRYQLPISSDIQKQGSAISYARRYSICALLNITADEDTDGNPPAKHENVAGKVIKQIADLTGGIEVSVIRSKIASLGKSKSEDLNYEELRQITRSLLVDFAVSNGAFTNKRHAENSYDKLARGFSLENPEILIEVAEAYLIKGSKTPSL